MCDNVIVSYKNFFWELNVGLHWNQRPMASMSRTKLDCQDCDLFMLFHYLFFLIDCATFKMTIVAKLEKC